MASELASEKFHPPTIPSEAGSLGGRRTGPDEPDQERERHGASCLAGGQHRVLPPGRSGTSRQRCPQLRRTRHASLRGLGLVWEGGSR
eukprot:323996-Pleurochrysis_carterae.AAC.1